MTEEVKEAYRIVEEYEKALREEKEANDYSMYRTAGCNNCTSGQIYSSTGGGYCSVTYYSRCDCSKQPTDRFAKFLEERDSLMDTMTAREFQELTDKWYDNYSYIRVGSSAAERSW